MTAIKKQLHLNPYDYHKYLINEYVLKKPGDTKLLKELDKSKWKTDKDVIIENMKFIWNEEEPLRSWEERLAKKYYDKLFREYCICDLSRYKENKIANRFRIEKEIVSGKGQFLCAEKDCQEDVDLRTWEVNFSYFEKGERKNALVKIRLCPSCSQKLNYHSKKREVKRKRLNRSRDKTKRHTVKSVDESHVSPNASTSQCYDETVEISNESPNLEQVRTIRDPLDDESLWKKSNETDTKGRDEEFDDYLADLLL